MPVGFRATGFVVLFLNTLSTLLKCLISHYIYLQRKDSEALLHIFENFNSQNES